MLNANLVVFINISEVVSLFGQFLTRSANVKIIILVRDRVYNSMEN